MGEAHPSTEGTLSVVVGRRWYVLLFSYGYYHSLKAPASKSEPGQSSSKDPTDDIPQKPTSSRIYSQPSVKNDDFEPDLLVLGFEELDLSAGALVVGSSTAREDAWTKAALAGLGDRGEDYVKVSLYSAWAHGEDVHGLRS